MKNFLFVGMLLLTTSAFAKEVTRKPSQVGGAININNKNVLVGEMNCGDGLVVAQILVNTMNQKVLVSDIVAGGKTIDLGQVQSFELTDSDLFLKAPGVFISAKIPTRSKGQYVIGVRTGIVSVSGKRQELNCFVPEISDFPM